MKNCVIAFLIMLVASTTVLAADHNGFSAKDIRLGLELPCMTNAGNANGEIELRWKDQSAFAVVDLECGYLFILPNEDEGAFIKAVKSNDFEHKEVLRFIKGSILVVYPPR